LRRTFRHAQPLEPLIAVPVPRQELHDGIAVRPVQIPIGRDRLRLRDAMERQQLLQAGVNRAQQREGFF
jgi:hypothetical protein